jgi:hypothetical protein
MVLAIDGSLGLVMRSESDRCMKAPVAVIETIEGRQGAGPPVLESGAPGGDRVGPGLLHVRNRSAGFAWQRGDRSPRRGLADRNVGFDLLRLVTLFQWESGGFGLL